MSDQEQGEIPGSEQEPPISAPSLTRLATVFYGVLMAAAVAWATLAERSFFYASPAAEQRGAAPVEDLAVGVVAGLLVILISRAITLQTDWGEALGRMLGAVLGPLSWPQCVLLALLSGVAEEAFFRGALQPAVGWVAASLLFGLAHFAPQKELLPWTAFTLAAGFLLGALFERTGNLIAPVTAHFLINAVNLHFLSERYATPSGPVTPSGP